LSDGGIVLDFFRGNTKWLVFVVCIMAQAAVAADKPAAFRFESVGTLTDMNQFVQSTFPLGSSRAALRHAFVDSGKATLKVHPTRAGVEKYIYDINLCDWYVWRWNISADYDAAGKLLQAYVNGEPVFAAGPQKHNVKDFPGHATIFKLHRARPQASKGEKDLAYMVYDGDSNLQTPDDELAIGGGPTRVDPINMGTLHMYASVDPWRSIFDKDDAQQIVSYKGSCAEVDEFYAKQKAAAKAAAEAKAAA
jgi:hypothetical protein